MRIDFYNDLKKTFSKIMDLHSGEFDQARFDSAVGDLKYSRKLLLKDGTRHERKILLYSIDSLLELIDSEDSQIIYDFANLVRDMPDIFLELCNFHSFNDEITLFNKKYHTSYFKRLNRIFPYFSKRAPKNALKFFSPDSDKEFKRKHPVGYVFLVILGILAFVLPLLLTLIFGTLYEKKENVDLFNNSGWFIPYILGCLVMGVGLFNIVAAFIHQYLGHKLTAICLGGGGALCAFSLFMARHPELYDVKSSLYCFVSLCLMIIPLVSYFSFRCVMGDWLKDKKRIKSRDITKLTKGMKNYWWYEALHKEYNLGVIYYLNKSFVSLFVVITTLSLPFGLMKEVSLILCPLYVLFYIISIVMTAFTTVRDNLEDYGKPFVFLKGGIGRGSKSIFIDLFWILYPLILAYINVKLACNIWGISI